MIFKIKCKTCANISNVSINELESGTLYKCRNCGKIMDIPDLTRLTNVQELIDFDVIEVYRSEVLENDITGIKKIFQQGDKNITSLLIEIIDKIYIIARSNDIERITELKNIINEFFLKSIDKKNQTDCNFLEMNYDNESEKEFEAKVDAFIDYIRGYIPNYNFTKKIEAKFKNMFRQYNGDYEFLIECVDISAERYLEYDEDDNSIYESANEFINKIGGIAYNRFNN